MSIAFRHEKNDPLLEKPKLKRQLAAKRKAQVKALGDVVANVASALLALHTQRLALIAERAHVLVRTFATFNQLPHLCSRGSALPCDVAML
jgi:hypothetical protein